MMRLPQRPGPAEEGFTLIEMLISIVITGIILAVLVSGFLVFFTNGAYTRGRDDHSAAAEILGVYLDRDAASATDAKVPAAPVKCTSGMSAQPLLTLSWWPYNAGTLPDSTPVQAGDTDKYTVVYALVGDNLDSSKCMIQRTYSSGAVQVAQNAVVHDLPLQSSASFTSSVTGATCGDSSSQTPLTATLQRYSGEGSGDYIYRGCLNARINVT